ncbi:hypothetical protein [Sphingopyxis alaskensis]|uniref:hypothetical protein n=1 Tax=Sphingopyxis alaskensis TaxID=117207 RepID=UPI00203CEE5B|nr:hypothetical protein [Sphingopyxis alaskensis]MCM3419039.1 hypothetical protein [Sphingopyxis alaskensis]
MSSVSLSPATFYAAWTPSLMFASGSDRASPSDIVITGGGIDWPVVTLAIAAIGVLAARPLSPKRNPPLPLWKNALVTLIMLVVALLWVVDTRPGLLFAFVVSIGLGFSGYTLIELMGEQISDYLRRLFAALPMPKLGSATTKSTDEEQA